MFDITTFASRLKSEKFIAALKIGTKYQLADFTTKSMALIQFMFLVLIAMGINSGDEPDP